MRKRSKFNLSNIRLFSGKMGYGIPVNMTEVLPGDSIQQSTGVFMRLAPMVAPVMHPVHIVQTHWFVPHRLVWPSFPDLITGGDDGLAAPDYPVLTLTPEAGSMADYLGLPLGHEITVSALPFRAMALIYNEFFRDQDLQAELPISLEDGEDTTTSTDLWRPCWTKDYFTTARPWPQKGADVTIPVDLGDASMPTITGTVTGTGTPSFAIPSGSSDPTAGTSNLWWRPTNDGLEPASYYAEVGSASWPGSTFVPGSGPLVWSDPALGVALNYTPGSGSLGSVDVRSLRESLALQRFQERRSLFGSRYEDYLRYLGVRPSDVRLQHPERLGGSSQTIQFSEVLQTAGDKVGALYGHGIAAMRGSRYRRFIPEHGYIFTILFVRPVPIYTQGIERTWSRRTREDFWQVEFQHIGQQEVLSKEVYADGTAADEDVFGYQNRYDEYRRGVSTVAGEFRTNQDYWHMARIFESRPALNSDFVEVNPTDRIFYADETNSDQLYCMVRNDIVARRLVDRNGNPI